MDAKKFKTLSEELETVTSFLPTVDGVTIVLCDGMGVGNPEFTEEFIRFNGNEKEGFDHETFSIDRETRKKSREDNGLVFNFCKTVGKPYDLMCKISMLRLKHHFPECHISCDGGAEDWKQAKKIYKKAFGEVAPRIN